MRTSRLIATGILGGGNLRYQNRVKNLFGSSLIGYWPLWEASGTAAEDISGNGRNGAYTGVELANTTSPGGKPCPLFAGADYVNVSSVGLSGAWNGNSFTVGGWAYQPDWSTAATGVMAVFLKDASNFMYIDKRAADSVRFGITTAGVASTVLDTGPAPTQGWIHFAAVFEQGQSFRFYLNGCRLITSYTGAASPASWVGSGLLTAVIGANNASGANPFAGNISDVFVRNLPSTDAEIWSAYSSARGGKKLSILGDSISKRTALNWTGYVQAGINGGYTGVINHAQSGQGIVAHMDAQTVEAATDDADLLIVALGANDNNAGDMTALQAEYAENIAELKLSNPRATIYAMNVLPVWTDITGATPIDKSNIRTAIAAACTAQGVTCWDTFSTPWITAADTSDGLHPNAAGHAKIATEVLARL